MESPVKPGRFSGAGYSGAGVALRVLCSAFAVIGAARGWAVGGDVGERAVSASVTLVAALGTADRGARGGGGDGGRGVGLNRRPRVVRALECGHAPG